MTQPSDQLTQLLVDWSKGNSKALDELIPLVYPELRRMAHHHLRRETPGHTLQTTALVNEAYLRLVDQNRMSWQNRAHFFAIAAQLMRRILIDHAKTRRRVKRGGGAQQVSLDEAMILSEERSSELLALDEALERLAAIDGRKVKVVEMRYFGGLSVEEVAEVLGIAPNTVIRDWAMAKAWLRGEISGSRTV